MLVVDASCLYEALVGGSRADTIRDRLEIEPDQAAPHVIDVEVFSVVRREHRAGRLDRTAASQAIEDLEAWPADRFSHRLLLDRAWQLRDTVRGYDAMYVALAEALNANIAHQRSATCQCGRPRCEIEVL